MAIHFNKSDLAQPGELGLDVEQFVRRIVIFGLDAESFQELALIEKNPRWQDLAEKWDWRMLFPGESIHDSE